MRVQIPPPRPTNVGKADAAALRQLTGCYETYFGAVAGSLQSKGLVGGFYFDAFSGAAIESPNIAAMPDPMITLDGTMFVSENSQMRKAKVFVGNAFEAAPSEAIKAAASHI